MTVDSAWQRIVDWCEHNAPGTYRRIRPSAGPDKLAEVERLFDRPWPDDLRRWYALQDGVDGGSTDAPLPNSAPYGLDGVAEQTEFYRSMYDDDEIGDEQQAIDGEAEPAGSTAFVWLPSFAMIAGDVTACGLYVDLRPGDLHGCVSFWDRDTGGADEEEPLWQSVAEMLEQTAVGLEAGEPVNGYLPVVEDGELSWDYTD